MEWSIKENIYIVRNVPVLTFEDGEEVLDLGVSIKLTTLRDLMVDGEILSDIDFRDFEDIEF